MHKNILDKYRSKLKTKIYKDKNFDPKGIDYTNYIALKFESINKGYIRDKYTANGWYILWYLMAEAQQKSYIKITLSMIAKDINISEKIIKQTLFILDEDGVIKVNCFTQTGKDKVREQIKATDTLEITIIYNTTDYVEDNGYRAIPTEWVKSVLPSVSAKAWTILTVLVVKYSWFSKSPPNEEGYQYNINHYAFPTYEQINKLTGISKATMKDFLKELMESKYSPIQVIGSNNEKSNVFKEGQVMRENYCYEVELLSRIEYQYYNTYLHNRDNVKDFDKLIGTSKQYDLMDKDYIISKFSLLKDYDKAIKEKDIDWYNTYYGNMKMRKDEM